MAGFCVYDRWPREQCSCSFFLPLESPAASPAPGPAPEMQGWHEGLAISICPDEGFPLRTNLFCVWGFGVPGDDFSLTEASNTPLIFFFFLTIRK